MTKCQLGLLIISTLAFSSTGCAERNKRHGGLTVEEAFVDPIVRKLAETAASGDIKAIDELLAKGADINAAGVNEITPLWWSIIVQNFTGFDHLLTKGANPNLQPTEHHNIMELAAMSETPNFLEAAIKAGGSVNLVSRFDGSTPIFWAIQGGQLNNIEIFVANGANLNFQDPNGQTPLIIAAGINGFGVVHYLLIKGADPKLKTKSGHSVLFAINNNRIDPKSDGYRWKQKVIELLKAQGIDVGSE